MQVLIVDDNADTRASLQKLLAFELDIEVVGTAASGEEAIELGKQLRPDVVLMDVNMGGIDGIRAGELLTREVPGVQIIIMSVQSEADYLRRAMLAGAREFLIKPFSADELITSLRRVYELGRAELGLEAGSNGSTTGQFNGEAKVTAPEASASRTGPLARRGRIAAAFGAKGGVGTSSLIVNLAVALREVEPEAQVALLDGDFELGDVAVLLNLQNDRSVADLFDHLEELDGEYMRDVMSEHPTGVKALTAPPAPAMATFVGPEHVRRILSLMREHFDYILVDTPTDFSERTLALLGAADTVLLVTTTEIPAVKNARLFFELSTQLKYDEHKVWLLLNKYDPRIGLTAEAIGASIKHQVVATIAQDDRLVESAMNQGTPFVMGRPRSQVSQDVVGLARKLAQKGREVQPAVARPSNGSAAAQPLPVKKGLLIGKLFNRA